MKLRRKEFELVANYIIELQKQVNNLQGQVDELKTKWKVLDDSIRNKKGIKNIIESSEGQCLTEKDIDDLLAKSESV